ncbi:MAG: rhodanese-like domain-containing protein [Phaeodactylibacter sp.]|nr:rhodanese-like domain-containing protein [Phaeodactylibacter sp.]MCB0612741.1 rhodanese-like domain-containing protein [Phaeodactylibacter sp.]
MKYLIFLLGTFFVMEPACSQPPASRPPVKNDKFDEELTRLLSFSVPTIGVQELRNIQNEVYIFDAREEEEYRVSHIEGARYLGYKKFDEQKLADVPEDARIVLYCSVGYRSEKIGERLQKMGFTDVNNLYGSIFEWVNQGYPVVGADGATTPKVHTYNSKWSQWVDNDKAEKVW